MAKTQRLLEINDSVVAFAPADSRGPEGARQLDRAARRLAPFGPPVIVFNASHSGSRLLAVMLRRLGVFMGSHLNDSEDSLDLFDLVKYLVEQHAPDYSRLFAQGDPDLQSRVQTAIEAHLQDRAPGQPWGWKLCETGHALPVISRLFPTARCIHLIRDGRDVAFSPFVAPKAPFWRKIYFNDDRISSWRGHRMTQRAYRAHGPLFNAARWVNSVSLGRAHGAMLGERYLEVRYEDLVADPAGQMARVAAFLGLEPPTADLECADVRSQSVGKWRKRSPNEIAQVIAVLEPALSAFGYGQTEVSTPQRVFGAIGRAMGRRQGDEVSAGPRADPGGLGGLFRVRSQR